LSQQQQPQQGAAANPMANPFAAMMMNPMAFAPAQPAQQPEVTYATQLRQLQDMGFYDAQANIRALVATGGDVNSAVAILLG
jgi:ubiquilin